MMVEIEAVDAAEALAPLTRAMARLTPALTALGGAWRARVQLGFRSGTDPDGNAWKPLSGVTLARRRKGGAGAKPLLDTGRLRNSFDVSSEGDTLTLGTTAIYAGTLQRGAAQGAYGRSRRNGPIPWGRIPARPMLPEGELPDAWLDDARRILGRHLTGATP